MQRQRQLQMIEIEKQKMEKEKAEAFMTGGNMVMVRRVAGDGAVTLAMPTVTTNQHNVNAMTACEQPAPASTKTIDNQRKQTWEQAIAHINQLAKGANKEKKKPKEQPKQEPKPKEPSKANDAGAESRTMSKKQKRLLAKMQAEEEEKKKQQQQETKLKKAEAKKAETPKAEVTKKTEKKPEPVKKADVVKKKEDKKEKKQEKVVEKKKDSKQEKNAPTPTAKPAKQPQAQQNNKKDNKKKDQQQQQQKPQVINITPDTTIEIVSKKNQCASEPEKPASCSIMEQLSCGVQVTMIY
ncbi:hypothetical protein O3G_MSEX015357 [Manduca sexta]|uniref:Uncharacterized protein n=1 Tax=Manduca sexta TaxID=7130 RepID=A0A921ZX08_MANSE|nr:hypothetical protein O3G_MSEX015357 [Manduca sexta]KAG6465736.1 hypothetical protein O3G_MSEX015357 [Manduca sexta]